MANAKITKVNKKVFVTTVTIQIILLQGLRNPIVGSDTRRYLSFYNNISSYDWQTLLKHRFEIGFKLFSKLCRLLGLSEQAYLFVISALIFIPLAYVIYKYSSNAYWSYYTYITLGFLGSSFCTLRQNIALCIILLSIKPIKERKLFKFIIIVLIASCFHISALFFLPAYFIADIKLTGNNILLISITSFIAFLFIDSISNFIVNKFFQSYEVVKSDSYEWFLFNILLYIVLLLYYRSIVLDNNELNSKDKNGILAVEENNLIKYYYPLTLVGILLMLFATTFKNAMRVVNIYYVFIILLIPGFFDNLNNPKDKKLIKVFLFILFGVIYIYFLNRPSAYQYVPYYFYWDDIII